MTPFGLKCEPVENNNQLPTYGEGCRDCQFVEECPGPHLFYKDIEIMKDLHERISSDYYF